MMFHPQIKNLFKEKSNLSFFIIWRASRLYKYILKNIKFFEKLSDKEMKNKYEDVIATIKNEKDLVPETIYLYLRQLVAYKKGYIIPKQ